MSDKIFINTVALYIKIIVTTILSLYTVPMLLKNLGVDSYGLYTLIAGFVALLSFFNGSLAMSTQRYTSYFLGRGDLMNLRKVFSYGFYQHLGLAIVMAFVLFLFADLFFSNILNIGNNDPQIARKVYYLSIGIMGCSIVSVPFDAIINSKEDLIFYAISEVLTSLFKLIIVFVLPQGKEALFVYCLLLFIWFFCLLLLKYLWCNYKYKEIKNAIFVFIIDRCLFKNMLSFSGWNILGAFSMMLKNQGSSVILNMFYGPVANASFSIAQQVNNASSVFSQTVLKSFAPQITKNFASGNMNSAIEMTLQNSKISLIVIILIAIPLLVETPTVLILWLGNPPDGSITFVRLMLILALCNQLSYGVMNIIQTQGRIRKYMISVSFLLLIILPVSYVLYRFYFPVYTILIVTIIVEILVAIVRVKFANKLACFPVARYLKEIIFPCFCVAVISFIVCFFLAHILQGGVTRFLLICTFSCVCVLILSYKFIFNLSEKSFIRKKLLCMIKKK